MRRQAREPNSFVQILRSPETSLLDPGGSHFPDLLVHSKAGFHVVGEAVLIGEDDAECCGIFDGLTRPLRLMRLIGPQSIRTLFVEWMSERNSPALDAQHHPKYMPFPCTNPRMVGGRTTSRACGRWSA